MITLPKTISLLTSCAVIATLALSGMPHWNTFALAATIAMLGLGVLYPLALSGDDAGSQWSARRGMQDVEVGPATTAILF